MIGRLEGYVKQSNIIPIKIPGTQQEQYQEKAKEKMNTIIKPNPNQVMANPMNDFFKVSQNQIEAILKPKDDRYIEPSIIPKEKIINHKTITLSNNNIATLTDTDIDIDIKSKKKSDKKYQKPERQYQELDKKYQEPDTKYQEPEKKTQKPKNNIKKQKNNIKTQKNNIKKKLKKLKMTNHY